jgi:hypothetical protein
MGSQNVTNFSAAKANRIRAQMEDFDPTSPQADSQAWFAAADAIGEFTKSNSFIQCLASSSFEIALRSIVSLASDFKYKQPEQVLKQFNIAPANRQPLGELAARITQSLSENLVATQQETKTAFAAKDAIARTLIDVVSESVPREKAASASPEEITEAFKKVPARKVSTLFTQNVFSSLLNMTFEAAAEGEIPKTAIAEIERRNREQLAAQVSRRIEGLARGKGLSPTQIPSFIRKNIDKAKSLKELESVRVKPNPPALGVGVADAGFRGIPGGPPLDVVKPKRKKKKSNRKPNG